MNKRKTTRTRTRTRTRQLDEHDERKALEKGKLSLLKAELIHAGFKVEVIDDWDYEVITPKIDVKFLRIMHDNHWTIQRKPFGNMANNTLNIIDIRKKPYLKKPINKDFRIRLAIKYHQDWDNPDKIRYTEKF